MSGKDGGNAMAWLKGMALTLGQYLPNVNETRLPFREIKLVHGYYTAEMKFRGQAAVNYSQFSHLWRNDVACMHIRFANDKGTFPQCDTCADFATEIQKARNASEADKIKVRWNVHIEQVCICFST